MQQPFGLRREACQQHARHNAVPEDHAVEIPHYPPLLSALPLNNHLATKNKSKICQSGSV
jgi:hypothetical protein